MLFSTYLKLPAGFNLYGLLLIICLGLIAFLPLESYGQGGPVLNVVPNNILCPGNSCQPVAQSVTITAAPGTMIDGASVYIYSGYVAGQDQLNFSPMFGINGNFNSTTGVLTLTGTATAAQYQTALQSICYSNSSGAITTGYRTIFYVLGALLYNPVNNHYYQLVNSANTITWTNAENTAAASNYLGMQGYLVTISDVQENNFLIQLVSANTWIGASDAAQSGVWRWVTGCEGLEDGGLGRHFSDELSFNCLNNGTGTSVGGNYINWGLNEPNDCFGIESYAHFWFYGEWNDLPVNGNVTNYIIEYGCMPNDPVVQTYDSISVYINDSIPTPVLASNMPVCDGDTIQLSSNGNYLSPVYQWSGPNSFSSTNQNTFVANASQALNGNYVLSVVDSGCTAISLININQPPPIQSTLNSITNVLCNGGNTGSIDQTGTNGAPGYTYSWSNGQTSAIASSLVLGTYTVTITDNNGCTGSSSFSVTEPTLLKDSITTTVDVSCKGSDGKATVLATGGAGGYTYLWSNGQTTTTCTGLFVGVFTVTVTDANNCTKTVTGSLISIPALATVTIANPSICIGQSATITIGASNGTSPYAYLWSTGATTTSVSVSPVLTSNYTATVTDENNCTATAVYLVTVNPALSISSISNDTTVCKGEPVTVKALAAGGNGNYTYQWSNGNINSSFTVSPLTTTTVYLTLKDNCGTPVAKDSVTISIVEFPVVDFTSSPDSGCMPLEVTFTDQSVAAPGSVYAWDFGDGGISNQQSPVYVYMKDGLYDVSLTVTTPQGCESVNTKNSIIDVFNTPVADFKFSPVHPSIFFNNVDFTDLSSGVVTFWNWNFGLTGANSNLQNTSYMYADTGKYLVTLIISNDHQCGDTTYQMLEVHNEFTAYLPNAFTPNDDGNNDYLVLEGFNYESFDLQIFNRWGQLVREAKNNPAWDGKDINGNVVQQGVYAYYLVVIESLSQQRHVYRGTLTVIR